MTRGSNKGEYKIRLGGPDEKVEFELRDSFFKGSEINDWTGGEIQADIEVIKTTGLITLGFHLKGVLDIMCDRCLEYFPQEIDTRQTLFVKFGDKTLELDEKVFIISRDESEIDISQFLNEFLILALPLKRVHPEKEDGGTACNKQMIEKLEQHLIQEVEESNDPRWDELKKLKD